jgi:hypothetical protein
VPILLPRASSETRWDPVSQWRPAGGFERDIRGECRRNQGLRHSAILVITPARTGEASRVLHPPRSSASGCSAKGRSATRSDSQRSHGRTRWDGHPAWGWKPRPHRALPSGEPAKPAAGERRTAAAMPRPWVVHVWSGRLATTRRPFRFLGVTSFELRAERSGRGESHAGELLGPGS